MRELRQSTGVKTYIYIYIYHANARENVKGSGCLNCLSGSLNNYFKDEKERKKKSENSSLDRVHMHMSRLVI